MAFSLLSVSSALSALTSTAASPVVVGGITLTGMEVPEQFTPSMVQRLSVKELPGGGKIIQNLGLSLPPLSFAGAFTGSTAQTRAKALSAIAAIGASTTLTVASITYTCVIKEFFYDYKLKGAILPYRIVVEPLPGATQTTTSSSSALSSLFGSGIASAVTDVTSTVTAATTYVSSAISQVSSIVGQVAPIASMLGVGGTLANASLYLSEAQGATGTVALAAQAPSALASATVSLASGISSLGSTISSASSNLLGMGIGVASSGAGLAAVTANAGVLAGSVQSSSDASVAIKATASTTYTPQVSA